MNSSAECNALGTTLRRGFTLVELLVVITIIGLLAALLLPVFASAHGRARQVACASNERQVGMAMLQYAADNDGRWSGWVWEKRSEAGWAHDAAYPYVRSAAVFRCPDDPTQDLIRADSQFPDWKPATPNSYALNSDLADLQDASFAASTKTVMLFEVRNCQETFTENHTYGTGSMAGDGAKALNCRPTGCADRDAQYDTGDIGGRRVNIGNNRLGRHSGGANYVACDGHVAWLRPENVSGGGSQPPSGGGCAQDDTAAGCGGSGAAAGTSDNAHALTFSVR